MFDIEEAKRAIEADRQARLEACAAEVQEVLDRYGFAFDLHQPPAPPAQLVLREVTS